MDRMPVVSVIGLGKLGAPIAATIAAQGIDVVGVDVCPEVVRKVNEGEPPVFETGLSEMTRQAGTALVATTGTAQAVMESDVTIILVPTPSERGDEFSVRYVLQACEGIGRGMSFKEDPHLVVLTSTVMPGHTGGPVKDTLEEYSGKRCGVDFGLCYSPEFVALGSVIDDFLNPEFWLIGRQESDPTSGPYLEAIYKAITRRAVPVYHTSWINAEIAKLSLNTFLTAKISFANTVAQICERLPGADVDEVTQALGLDGRIGDKYLKGGQGYGGPCFPRDTRAFSALAGRLGANPVVSDAVTLFNSSCPEQIADIVLQALGTVRGGSVCIMGMAYKAGTPVIEESPSVRLAQVLMQAGVRVSGHDPLAEGNIFKAYPEIEMVDFRRAVEHDVLVLATRDMEWVQIQDVPLGGRAIVDCWRLLDPKDLAAGVHYVALGRGPA